jgi:hypothetical protein
MSKAKIYADGSRYEGEWKNMKKHGKGMYQYANGDKYIGDWIDDRRTGQGVFTWINGNRYEKKYSEIAFHDPL